MSKTNVSVHVEIEDGRAWTYAQREIGDISSEPLHSMLRWVLEQINFGCYSLGFDESGAAVSLTLGRSAARELPDPLMENALEEGKTRVLAVNIAGLFAVAREAGIGKGHESVTETVRFQAKDDFEKYAGVWMNTELHYAFQFVDLLSRIQGKTFEVSSPPIKGVLSKRVSELLGEATRAHLYNLNSSSVAMCRALLEKSLKDCVDENDVSQEMMATHRGEFESLINVAKRKKCSRSGRPAFRIKSEDSATKCCMIAQPQTRRRGKHCSMYDSF